ISRFDLETSDLFLNSEAKDLNCPGSRTTAVHMPSVVQILRCAQDDTRGSRGRTIWRSSPILRVAPVESRCSSKGIAHLRLSSKRSLNWPAVERSQPLS